MVHCRNPWQLTVVWKLLEAFSDLLQTHTWSNSNNRHVLKIYSNEFDCVYNNIIKNTSKLLEARAFIFCPVSIFFCTQWISSCTILILMVIWSLRSALCAYCVVDAKKLQKCTLQCSHVIVFRCQGFVLLLFFICRKFFNSA